MYLNSLFLIKWNENVENFFLFGKNCFLGKIFVYFIVMVVKVIVLLFFKFFNNNLLMYKFVWFF